MNGYDFTMVTHNKAVEYIKKNPVLNMLVARKGVTHSWWAALESRNLTIYLVIFLADVTDFFYRLKNMSLFVSKSSENVIKY